MSGIATAIIGGAVISGVMGNKAAGKAARATRGAADASIAEQQRQFDLVRGDTAPYRDVGQGALYQLAGLTGLSGFEGGGGRRLNSSEQEELSSLAGLSREAQGGGGFDEGGFLDAVRAERGRYTGENIAPGENEFSILTNPEYENITPAQRASTLDNLKQYFPGVARDFDRRPVALTDAQGQRLEYLQGISSQPQPQPQTPARTPTEILEATPGYQFRLSESEKALQRMQSARGMSLGPRAAKELGRYVSDYASGEYGNYLESLFRLSGLGGNAVNTSANAGANAASGIGSANQFAGAGAANAAFAGGQATNNAIQGGLSNWMTLKAYNDSLNNLGQNNQPFYGVGASPY